MVFFSSLKTLSSLEGSLDLFKVLERSEIDIEYEKYHGKIILAVFG